jgi:molecular chaperone DnaJ
LSAKDYLEKDYYSILGVAKDADAATLKKKYRKLARELHPDTNKEKGAEDKFKAVSEAYDVLSDPKKRTEYDQMRTYGASNGGFGGGGFNPRGSQGQSGFNVNLEDVLGGFNLGDLFGGGGGRKQQRSRRGSDLETEVSISFNDCLDGTTLPLTLRGQTTCNNCKGSGAKPGTNPKKCSACNGSGQTMRNAGGFGFADTCSVCYGTGRIIEQKDPNCNGTGIVNETRTITARIPAGIKTNSKLRLKGKGEPGGSGGEPGDLIVNVIVKEDEIFQRDGDNVRISVPIRYDEAVFGAQIAIPVPSGTTVTLKIPAHTQNGRTFRVKNEGMTNISGTKGDLLVKVEIAVPQNISGDAKDLLAEYAKEVTHDNPRAEIIALNARRKR